MRKILKFKKVSKRNIRMIKIILTNTIIERSSFGLDDLKNGAREYVK